MTLAQFLLDEIPPGLTVHLTGDEARHAVVKRLHRGEQVLVGDGRGTVLTCAVSEVGRDVVELAVLERRVVAPSEPRLVVVQALPKGDRADLAVEVLTELGADEIVPWSASHCVVRWTGDRAVKGRLSWQRTAREAAKQSRRAWLPDVAELVSTAQVIDRVRSAAVALALHEDAVAGIATVGLAEAGEIVVVVGPEGGISPDELAGFTAAGAEAVRLGAPVLRTSTAGAAALAALSVRLGRWA